MSEQARILHVVLNDFTRDTRVARSARLGVGMGAEVRVLALWSEGLPREEDQDGYRIRRVPLKTRPLPKRRSVQLVKYVELVARLYSLARAWPPNLVHAHDFNALLPASLVGLRSGAGLVYDSHELWYDRTRGGRGLPGPVMRSGLALERMLARRADRVVTVSEGIAEEMEELLEIERPTVVRNVPEAPGVGSPEAGERGAMREALDLEPEIPVVLYQGGMLPDRGLSELVAAADRMDHPTAVLVFLGSGPMVDPLSESARRLGLGGKVRFHEAVPPDILPGWTVDATLGVHPIRDTCLNHRFCLPNKLFEYIQAGLPVLVSDLPEMRRIVERYEVGRVFPGGDVESLANSLDRMLGDPDALQRWRAAARDARKELTWERESRKLKKVYRTLLDPSSGSLEPPLASSSRIVDSSL